MTSDIGKGLVYLHENMVHRDIKPVIYSSPKPTMHMRQNTQHPSLFEENLCFANLLILFKDSPQWLKLKHYFLTK